MNEADSAAFIQSNAENTKALMWQFYRSGFAMGKVAIQRTDIYKQYRLNLKRYTMSLACICANALTNRRANIFGRFKTWHGCEKWKGMVAYGLAKSLIFLVRR
jgi:hypothetical protein